MDRTRSGMKEEMERSEWKPKTSMATRKASFCIQCICNLTFHFLIYLTLFPDIGRYGFIDLDGKSHVLGKIH